MRRSEWGRFPKKRKQVKERKRGKRKQEKVRKRKERLIINCVNGDAAAKKYKNKHIKVAQE